MRKFIVFFAGFFIFGVQIYAQDFIEYYINKCIGLLGSTVPNGFQRMNRTGFKNDEDIIIMTENNIVIVSMFGSTFDRTNEAADFNSLFYGYFENNGWRYYDSTYDDSDIYVKGEIYAVISNPTRRDDGLIVAMIVFSRNINNFL